MLAAHRQVTDSGRHNHAHCRLPVPTHLNIEHWRALMESDQDSKLVELLEFGFPINYTKNELPAVPFTNHGSATAHSHIIDGYISKELSQGATIGPFTVNPLITDIVLSPLQSVPKKSASDPNARRVVLDLSYPHNDTSVNAGIPRDSYLGDPTTLTYPSIDALANMVLLYGQDVYCSKWTCHVLSGSSTYARAASNFAHTSGGDRYS